MSSGDRQAKGRGGKKRGLTVQRASREAPFDESVPSGEPIPASPTEVLVVPSALAARRSSSSDPIGKPPIPTVRLGMPNSSMSGPPSPSDEMEEAEDLRTVAIESLAARDPFGGEQTESFDPNGARSAPSTSAGSMSVSGDRPNDSATVRFAAEADTLHRPPDPTHSSADAPAPEQPDWFVNGRKVDLPRPPGGAPSVFGDVPTDELAPPPALDDDGNETRPTVADAHVEILPVPTPSRSYVAPVAFAVVVACIAAGATAWATGALDALAPTARSVDALLEKHTGHSLLAYVAPEWRAPAEEPVDVGAVQEVAPPVEAAPVEPTPIPVRIELVNDASGSLFAPLSDPMRDRFLATLLKIKPFTAAKRGSTPRFRFTLFIGGTDVTRDADLIKGTTSCSLAATEEGTGAPATVVKAVASQEITSKRVVVPPLQKKRVSRKQRAAHAKQVEAAERAEESALRQVARTTVARCGYELATSFAEKTLAPPSEPARATTPPSTTTPTTTTPATTTPATTATTPTTPPTTEGAPPPSEPAQPPAAATAPPP